MPIEVKLFYIWWVLMFVKFPPFDALPDVRDGDLEPVNRRIVEMVKAQR